MMKTLMTAVAVALVAASVSAADDVEHDTRGIRHQVADAYGVHAFEDVVKVSFTFNVKAGEREVRREWEWWPHERRVRYAGGTWRDGEPFEYHRSDLDADSSETMVAVDQRFINDSYWLVFPYHVEWDVAAQVTDEGMAPLPDGEGSARKVVVDYTGAGGYTPGDIYELYVGPDYRIVQWVFRAGGQAEGSPMTWAGDARFGDVSFATEHVTPDGGARVFFTDIAVEFAGE